MASSSEKVWTTLAVAAGTLVIAGLVLSAPAVQRCQGSPDGIWSCLRQQVIDYGLLPEEAAEQGARQAVQQDATGLPTPQPPQLEDEAPAPTSSTEPTTEAPETAVAANTDAAADSPADNESSSPSPAKPSPVTAPAEVPEQSAEPKLAKGAQPEPAIQTPEADVPTPGEGSASPDIGRPKDIVPPEADGAAGSRPMPASAPELSGPPSQTEPTIVPAPTEPPAAEAPATTAEAVTLDATAQSAGSASATLAANPDLNGPSLTPSATPGAGIDIALLSGVTLEPVEPETAEPAQPKPLTPAEPAEPSPPAGQTQPTAPVGAPPSPVPDMPLRPAVPDHPLAPSSADALAPASPAARDLAPVVPPPLTAAEPPHESQQDAPVEEPAPLPAAPPLAVDRPAKPSLPLQPANPRSGPPAIDPSPAIQRVAEQFDDARNTVAADAEQGAAAAPEPVPVPPPPTVVASAAPGTSPALNVTISPTIDAVEIDGDINLFAGTGPEGARVDLFVGNRYIDSATVEGGRWLVESRGALEFPSQRLHVSVASQADGALSVGSDAILDFNVAPAGVRLVGKEAAAALPDTLQVESELEPGSTVTRLVPLESADSDMLRFRSGKAIIRRGDTLWAIARRVYGRGILYRQIYEANREQIRRPGRIYPGQVFELPSAP